MSITGGVTRFGSPGPPEGCHVTLLLLLYSGGGIQQEHSSSLQVTCCACVYRRLFGPYLKNDKGLNEF